MRKKSLFILLSVCCAVSGMADTLTIVNRFEKIEHASVLASYRNEFGSFIKPQLDVEFPYALIRVHIDGNEAAVTKAKERFALYLGQHHAPMAKVTNRVNEIMFLVPVGAGYVELQCGDGCQPLTLFNYPQLAADAIYEGKVRYALAKLGPTSTPNPKKQIFSFEVNPKNASVEVIVGEKSEYCKIEDDIQSITLNHGTYKYIVSAPRYQTETGIIQVSDSTRTKSVQLLPDFGWLTLSATESNSGASVYVINTTTKERIALGNIPLASYELDRGEYLLQIFQNKYKDYTKKITILPNETIKESPVLEPNFISLTLSTDTASEIFVNGESYGKGQWSGTLELGEYAVETRKNNHRSSYIPLTLTHAEATQTITLAEPTPICGSLTVSGSPAKAAIYIDDKYVGESPMIVNDLLIGEHEVKVEKDGCAVWKKTVIVAENEECIAKYELEKGVSLNRIVLKGLNATNLSVQRDGDETLVFTYDLPKKGPVRLRMSTDGYTYVDQKNVKGDVGKEMDKGKQYQIAWTIPKDIGRTMKDSLYFQVVASPKLPDNGIEIKIGPLFYEDASDPFSVCINNVSNVKKITIPTTITYKGYPYRVTKIGFQALSCCYQLLSITIPNSVTSIGPNAFFACHNLTSITIPNSVRSIGEDAFFSCTDLTSITIPNSVTSIGERVFGWCNNLTSIIVDKNNPIYDSRNNCNAIIETKTNTLIAGCKNTVIPNSVISIGSNVFSLCKNLTSITIPNSVTSIGEKAFSRCTDLTSITIPNSVRSIGEEAFSGCDDLTSIVVDKNNPIYDSRNNCNAIIETKTNTLIVGCKNTVIPNSVTSIGEGAFRWCTDLTSVTIPKSVTSIGEKAFSFCDNLTSISVDKDNPIYDSRDNCNAIIETATNTLIAGCKSTEIPNSVTSIGEWAFYGCDKLTSITIPNSVTSIGDGVFFCCWHLTSITIPNSVTSIGKWAFSGCDKLKKIYIPRGTKAKFAAMKGLKDHVDKLVEK